MVEIKYDKASVAKLSNTCNINKFMLRSESSIMMITDW